LPGSRGRHRSHIGGSLRTPAAIAAIVALVAVAAVAVRTVAADARGCANDLRVSVAAAPDIEPVIREIATRWSATDPKVDGDCVDVQVHAAEPADVANLLSVQAGGTINVAADTGSTVPTPSEADVPAVWIADSSAWITRMEGVNRDAFEGDSRSLAASPVVFAVPEGLAGSLLPAGTTKLGAQEIGAVLGKLANGSVKLAAVEPRRSTAGLVGATALKNAVVASPADLVNMVRAYRAVEVAPTQRELLDAYTENEIAPMSEQALAGYDRTSPSVPLVAVPLNPSVTLDYPYIKVTGKSRATAQAADLFRAALTADGNRDAYYKAGFRAADGSTGAGFPAGHGISPLPVPPQPFADGATINEILGYWIATKSPSRILTLVDVTSSMTKPFILHSGAQAARIDVLRQTALDGLKLFTDDSELGLWAFASGHQELAPVAVLDAAQRARLSTALSGRSVAAADECGLYESVLAAYKTLRDGYRAGRSNTVVVFTDGRNSKPGMSLDDFETQLELATDPTRPVRVVLLGIGPDVDQNELNAIAQRTGGRAFSVQDPEQIGTIFLQALLRPGS
jgi:hypothetical protein